MTESETRWALAVAHALVGDEPREVEQGYDPVRVADTCDRIKARWAKREAQLAALNRNALRFRAR